MHFSCNLPVVLSSALPSLCRYVSYTSWESEMTIKKYNLTKLTLMTCLTTLLSLFLFFPHSVCLGMTNLKWFSCRLMMMMIFECYRNFVFFSSSQINSYKMILNLCDLPQWLTIYAINFRFFFLTRLSFDYSSNFIIKITLYFYFFSHHLLFPLLLNKKNFLTYKDRWKIRNSTKFISQTSTNFNFKIFQ